MSRQPAQVFHPGEYIEDELEARGWTVSQLADMTQQTEIFFNEIINGTRGISTETSEKLAKAFGTSSQLWKNLDAAYNSSVELTKPSDCEPEITDEEN